MSGASERKASLRGTAGEQDTAPETPEETPPADPEPTAQDEEEEPEEDEPEWTEYHDDGSITVRFSRPLAPYHGKGADPFHGTTKLTLREIYAGDMIAMDADGGDMTKITSLAKELSKVPASLIERLHWEDFARVHGVINVKLGKFLGTSALQWRHSQDSAGPTKT